MTSQHPHEGLSAYMDGELDDAGRRRVEDHLAGCRACAALLEDLRLLARATAQENVPPAPAGLTARILEHVPREVVGRRRHWIHRMPLAAAASLAGAAVIWLVFQQAPSLTEPDFGPDPSRQESDATAKNKPATAVLPERKPAATAPAEPPEARSEQRAAKDFAQVPAGDEMEAETPTGEEAARMAAALDAAHGDAAGAGDRKEDAPARPKPLDRVESAQQRRERLAGGRLFEPSSEEPTFAPEPAAADARESVQALGMSATSAAQPSSQFRLRQSVAEPGHRELVLEEAGNEIRLTEAGQLSVQAAGYACSVLLIPSADAGPTPVRDDADREAPAESEIVSLFRLGGSGASTPDAGTAERDDAHWKVTLENRDGQAMARGNVNTDVALEVRRRLHALVQEQHRADLESACGPLPVALQGSAENP